MPNIRSQRVDSSGISIVASDGRAFSVTRAQIKAYYDSRSGSVSSKTSATVSWFRAAIVAALGSAQIGSTSISFTFNVSGGTPVDLDLMVSE